MKKIILLMLFIFAPLLASAEVVITEIMYDPEGSDTGREWVEVHNTSGQDIPIDQIRFREEESNHKLVPDGSHTHLRAGNYAIIVADPAKFKNDWPSFAGLILDSTFSLKNTGELLSIIMGDTTLYSYSFDSSLGAAGDGNSLQNDGSMWKALAPTPGRSNDLPSEGGNENGEEPSDSEMPEEETATSTESTEKLPESTSTFPVEPQIFSKIKKRENVVTAGVEELFEGYGWGLKKEPLVNARYIWNFGDGHTVEARKAAHAFRHPGEYIVVFDVASDEFAATDRIRIKVVDPQLELVSLKPSIDGYVEIKNAGRYDVSVGGMRLRSGPSEFYFPPSTIIGAGLTVRISSETLRFVPLPDDIVLLYPNGRVLVEYIPKHLVSVAIPAAPKPSVLGSIVTAPTPPKETMIISEKNSMVKATPSISAATSSPVKAGQDTLIISTSAKPSIKGIIGGISLILVIAASLFIFRKRLFTE